MKVHLEAYGCTQNMGEIERFRVTADSLSGVVVVETPEEASVCVIGTCIVIETTQLKMFRRIEELTELGKTVGVTGCLPKVFQEELDERFPNSASFDFTDLEGFKEWLAGLAKTTVDDQELDGDIDGGEFHSEEGGLKTAIIPISQGCLGACAYCITRLARGKLRSYDPEELIKTAKGLIGKGYKEILVTAQDTAAYGRDIDQSLPKLISRIAEIDPPDGNDFHLRIGMMNPNNAMAILPELVEMYSNPRVFRFLHIPVQSGSDRVLKKMGRRYSVEQFEDILAQLRNAHPDMVISTDIIVGFPSETYDEFLQSCDLIRKIKPDILNVTRFSARPGTPAHKMEGQIHGRINKQWSRELTDIRKEVGLEINKTYIGRTGKALVTEKGSRGKLITRLDNYKVALVDEKPGLEIGQWVNVEITDAAELYVMGRIIPEFNI